VHDPVLVVKLDADADIRLELDGTFLTAARRQALAGRPSPRDRASRCRAHE
jgi:hypothetical protein